jgi:DNA-binding CsgD family transcriptional regulator
MKRVPQQPEERFEAVLREGHRRARRANDFIKDFREYLYENPTKAADDLLFIVPKEMDALEREAWARFGYDLRRRRKGDDFALEGFSAVQEFIRIATHYYTLERVMRRWAVLVNIGLSGESLLLEVCEQFLEAYRERPGLAAVGIEFIEAGLPDRFKGLALSAYLTSYLATHTSLHANPRLRHSIDELRGEGESRFARLLKELPAEALAAYRERSRDVGNLMDIRTEAARRLEKRDAPADLQGLAAFADRENLLKYAKTLRLSPQELEVFKLCTENPTLKYREIADQLGISTSQVGVIKHRIKNKLAVGF